MAKASDPREGKRAYRSPARQRQAKETCRRILAATRERFASRGYAGTTVEAIAEVADVSPKTITAVFGSKRTLLAELINPDAFSSQVQQLIVDLHQTPDPAQRLALVVQIAHQAYEPLVSELELLRTSVWRWRSLSS